MAYFRTRYLRRNSLVLLTILVAFLLVTDVYFTYTYTHVAPDSILNTHVPRHHIAYVKVHKAASSTIQNILLRYGYVRNMIFVLGRHANVYPNVISITESVTDYNIEPPPVNKTFDILCSHVIYNRASFRAIMPRDTIYLASVREPFEIFISTLHYFRPPYIFDINVTDPISVYLENPSKYEPMVKNSLTNNRMAFELGFPLHLFHSRNWTGIQNYLEKLDREMDLILVVELLEESVVLLKRLLNWKLQDVLYVPKNTFKALHNETKALLNKKFHLIKGAKEKYRAWADLDYILYDFAIKRLQRQIRGQDPNFEVEVKHYKIVRKKVEDFCLNESKPYRRARLVIPPSVWNEEFVVDSVMCSQMILREAYFIQEIRYKQYGILPKE